MQKAWISSMKHTGLILLVDDDAAIRQFLCAVLVHAGYEVLAAKDSDEAVRTFHTSTHPPDLLITDVAMPGMSGPELMRALVGAGAIAHGFLISGDPGAVNFDLVEQQVGFPVRLLKKPILPAELLRMVAKLLSPKSAARGAAPFTGTDQISSFPRHREPQN
jgi:CheY-like chemotaxis protein